MYGLVVLLSVGILAAAWGVFDAGTRRRGDTERGDMETLGTSVTSPYHRVTPSPRHLVAYVLLTTAALYTQYYAVFLPIGLTLYAVWRWRRDLRSLLVWLAAQAIVALLYLPWVLYAAPKLLPYVSQKVVADADRSLGIFTYLGRHLSAFLAGHLEGSLARWWPVALLLLVPLLIGWILSRNGCAPGVGAWEYGSSGVSEPKRPLRPVRTHAHTPIPLLATVTPHRAHPRLARRLAGPVLPGAW